jgi:hypothetical protein
MIAANVCGGMSASGVRRRMCLSTLPSRSAISSNGGTLIDDQENRACGAGDEVLEKFNEDGGIDTALLLDHEPHPASRGDRREVFRPSCPNSAPRDDPSACGRIAKEESCRIPRVKKGVQLLMD